MATRANSPVTVTLGNKTAAARRFVEDGRYESLSAVLRAGVEALERQDTMLEAMMKAAVDEVLADPRPFIPLEQAFDRVEARLRARG